jgi:predicted RNase H-like HicB family nuclease
MEKKTIIIECIGEQYSAYIEDIPGLISFGTNLKEVLDNLVEGYELHMELLSELDGDNY